MKCCVSLWHTKSTPRRSTYHVSVIGQDTTEPRLPYDTGAEILKAIDAPKVQDGNHAGQVASCGPFGSKFVYELLDSFDCTG